MKREEIQFLPSQAKRVETGVVQFGDDWPGVFIRGDRANYLAFQAGEALHMLNPYTELEPPSAEALAVKAIESIKDLLESSNVGNIEGYFKTQNSTLDRIEREAEEEIAQERRRERIDAVKARLRNKKPFWHKVFPWKITINRR